MTIRTALTLDAEDRAGPTGVGTAAESGPERNPATCADCPGREACLPAALPYSERGNHTFFLRQRIRRGHLLYRAGDAFSAICTVRSGCFKSQVTGDDGSERMTGIHLCGEVLGTDGIATGKYTSDLVALEDSDVCPIPFCALKQLSAEFPSVQQWFHKVLGRQIATNTGMIALLGARRADERLAAFLLDLSRRFAACGFSPREFDLPVTHRDIGSHLGLCSETTSRAFCRLQRGGLIRVRKQRVALVDIAGLKKSAGGKPC